MSFKSGRAQVDLNRALRIDLPSMFLGYAGAFDATEKSRRVFTFPNDNRLKGISLWSQAMDWSPSSKLHLPNSTWALVIR